ncbi:hypothetical protein GKZ90_0009155 [Flavobacterium sp. MC2016-06]|uniref:hypothetical protein n=1 Tax=Flavobacterium sp. MC2016-06 TaxID=2676308 RepID=UPI0018ACE201|nr:hypothetical protein [Flavobacterium sp. MC2016-06]MBU3859368.1 hypothetical protein [Flavobacterium sp. MC2016-06]
MKTEIISIKCPYAEIGIKCRTCGLTSSFKKIINGDLYNINFGHLLLFGAFVSQLIIRPLMSFILVFLSDFKRIRNIDISFSIILFGYAYIQLILH